MVSEGRKPESRPSGGGMSEPPFNPDDDIPFFHPYEMMERTL